MEQIYETNNKNGICLGYTVQWALNIVKHGKKMAESNPDANGAAEIHKLSQEVYTKECDKQEQKFNVVDVDKNFKAVMTETAKQCGLSLKPSYQQTDSMLPMTMVQIKLPREQPLVLIVDMGCHVYGLAFTNKRFLFNPNEGLWEFSSFQELMKSMQNLVQSSKELDGYEQYHVAYQVKLVE